MSVTILETLMNAEHNIQHRVMAELGLHQLHNAIVLLEKGYDADTEIDDLLEQYDPIESAPEV